MYYFNGQLKSKEHYILDIPVGIWEYYYPNGKLKELGSFGYKTTDMSLKPIEVSSVDTVMNAFYGTVVHNQYTYYKLRQGIWYQYDRNGNLIYLDEYKDGVRVSRKKKE